MTVKIGEIGKTIFLGTGDDLDLNSAPFTELTINFTNPDGTVKFARTTADGVAAPAIASPDLDNVGILPANKYMTYQTKAGDFDTGGVGDWTVCTEYQDAVPSLFSGNDTTITIQAACD